MAKTRKKSTPEFTVIDTRRELAGCTWVAETTAADLARCARRWDVGGRAEMADVLTRLEDRLEMHEGAKPKDGWERTRSAVRSVRRRLEM